MCRMDYIEFYVPTKPISQNHAKYRDFSKKTATRVYETFIDTFLRYNRKHAAMFADSFDKTEHFIEANYYFCNATERFFTKGGWVSRDSIDTDNCIKIIQDKVFNFIGIDDKIICKSTQFKMPFQIDAIVITLKLRNLNNVEDMLPQYIRENLIKMIH